MGVALDWLGPEGCRTVAMDILQGVDTSHSTDTKVASDCPFHLETSPGGAFFYDVTEDVGFCHSCRQAGDLVDIFSAVTGRPLKPGGGVESEVFREFKERYAPDAQTPDRRRLEPVKRQAPVWTPRQAAAPAVKWSERAGSFVAHSVERLVGNPEKGITANEEALAELERLGLPLEAVKVCRLGWNDKQKFPPVTSWGLPYSKGRTGKEAKIYLPPGLVIPYAPGGEVVKVKVRQLPGEDPKYWQVKGSYAGYAVYGNPAWRVWLIIETERDAAMAWWWCRRYQIGAMATGSASARPDRRAAAILDGADLILNALDYDEAGARQADWWEEQYYGQYKRWPVPPSFGKDPGDLAVAAGGEAVAQWAWEGVPAHVREELQPAQPLAAPSTEPEEIIVPDVALRALDLCRKCRDLVAGVEAREDVVGLPACSECRRGASGCEAFRGLSELLFGPDGDELEAFVRWIGGRLDLRTRF